MADDTPKDEKTEAATPKKLEEAREKGSVALSQDFVASTMLIGACLSFLIGGPHLLEATGSMTTSYLGSMDALSRGSLDPDGAAKIMEEGVTSIAWPLALVLMPMLAVGLLSGYGQIGFRFASKALELQWSRFDLVKGAKRIVGPRGAMRLLQALLKVLIIGTVLVVAVWLQMPRLYGLVGSELGPLMRGGLAIFATAVAAALTVVLLISLVDLIFQRLQFAKDQRMTKSDVKRERKQDEGDPQIKGKIRTIQRDLAMRRMMQDVPEATVVITNPTHYAVALRYEPDADPLRAAPLVLAKGIDGVAQKIKAVAREADVPLYEDVPLARSLYARVEVGEEVPEELYQAVATVIQFVWKMRGRATAAGGVD